MIIEYSDQRWWSMGPRAVDVTSQRTALDPLVVVSLGLVLLFWPLTNDVISIDAYCPLCSETCVLCCGFVGWGFFRSSRGRRCRHSNVSCVTCCRVFFASEWKLFSQFLWFFLMKNWPKLEEISQSWRVGSSFKQRNLALRSTLSFTRSYFQCFISDMKLRTLGREFMLLAADVVSDVSSTARGFDVMLIFESVTPPFITRPFVMCFPGD